MASLPFPVSVSRDTERSARERGYRKENVKKKRKQKLNLKTT